MNNALAADQCQPTKNDDQDDDLNHVHSKGVSGRARLAPPATTARDHPNGRVLLYLLRSRRSGFFRGWRAHDLVPERARTPRRDDFSLALEEVGAAWDSQHGEEPIVASEARCAGLVQRGR